jgi:hypothetical protein
MVEEFRWPLELATGCGFGRDTVLATTTRVTTTSLALLPSYGVYVVRVRCFICGGVRSNVMYNTTS